MSEERAERCETCRFFDPYEDEGGIEDGWCHRYPPSIKYPKVIRCHCPVVLIDDWCGEWKPIGPDLTTRTDEALPDESLLAALSRAGL